MLQCGLPHRAGTDLKPVVLPHSPGRMDKRVLTTEIGHHSLQTSRATPRTRPNGLTQQTHVALALRAPDALLYADRTKDTPPCQPFFLRTLAELSFAFNCSLSLLSVRAPQLPMLVWPKRRISPITHPSTSSARFTGPAVLVVISRIVLKRSISSGCSRSCSIKCNSSVLNVVGFGCLSFIPTVNSEVAKFVHLILHLAASFLSPTFNHTRVRYDGRKTRSQHRSAAFTPLHWGNVESV